MVEICLGHTFNLLSTIDILSNIALGRKGKLYVVSRPIVTLQTEYMRDDINDRN